MRKGWPWRKSGSSGPRRFASAFGPSRKRIATPIRGWRAAASWTFRRHIDAGADLNARDNHGYTPLDATRYDRETQAAAKLEIAELLRAKGAKRRPTQAEEPGR